MRELLPLYRKLLERLGCEFRLDGTVKAIPYHDKARELENERLRIAFEEASEAECGDLSWRVLRLQLEVAMRGDKP